MKAVFLDFGNVVAFFYKLKACAILANFGKLSAEQILEIIVGSGLEKKLESGQISPTTFCNEVMQRCGITSTVPDMMRIWGNIFKPNDDIVPFVDNLIDKRVKIGVISNTNAVHWPFISDVPVMLKLAKYGAQITLSHEAGVMKPDPRIFRTALAKLGVSANEALFIDDIETYVQAARGVGMKAEVYDATKHDASKLRQIFMAHNLL